MAEVLTKRVMIEEAFTALGQGCPSSRVVKWVSEEYGTRVSEAYVTGIRKYLKRRERITREQAQTMQDEVTQEATRSLYPGLFDRQEREESENSHARNGAAGSEKESEKVVIAQHFDLAIRLVEATKELTRRCGGKENLKRLIDTL